MLKPQYLAPSNPRPKKSRLVFLVLLLIVFGVGLYFLYSYLNPKEEVPKVYNTICGFDIDQTVDVFESRPLYPKREVSDIFFYGESLNLTENPYELHVSDPLHGKTVTLYNLCSGDQYSFLSTRSLDINVLTYALPVGFYEILVEDNFVMSHLTTSDKRSLSISTVRREQQSKTIEVFSDRDYFIHPQTDRSLFSSHVLFLKVDSKATQDYDLILDPTGFDQDFDARNTGIDINKTFNTANKSYESALQLQQELEEKGLKVGLTRPGPDIFVNTYGESGRVHQGYEAGAKLMIQLDFATIENARNRDFMVTTSNFVSRTFAEMMAEEILKVVDFDYETQRGFIGSILAPMTNRLDRHNLIRESGGKGLAAGTYSDLSARTNDFARDNLHGMQAISVSFGDMRNDLQLTKYLENESAVVEAMTTAILRYLRIAN